MDFQLQQKKINMNDAYFCYWSKDSEKDAKFVKHLYSKKINESGEGVYKVSIQKQFGKLVNRKIQNLKQTKRRQELRRNGNDLNENELND